MIEHEVERAFLPEPTSRWLARGWMAWTLAGVLLACLAAFILVPLRALVTYRA